MIKNKYYKIDPFIKGKLYDKGIYIGRMEEWNCDYGSFMFDNNGEIKTIHPSDTEIIESTKQIHRNGKIHN
jgi:hypothetical protein